MKILNTLNILNILDTLNTLDILDILNSLNIGDLRRADIFRFLVETSLLMVDPFVS